MCAKSLDSKFTKVSEYFWETKKQGELTQYYAKYPLSMNELELRTIGHTLKKIIGQEELELTNFTSGTINETVEFSDQTIAQIRGCFMEISTRTYKIKILTNLFNVTPEHGCSYNGIIVEISNNIPKHKAILHGLETYLNTWPNLNITKNK
jgi:hypothetical protein